MDSTSLTSESTVTSSSSSTSSSIQSTTEIVEISTQPSNLLVSPAVTPSPPPLTTVTDADYITAVGLCGVNGYEAEVNHAIGLCREARTDFNLLLTVAKCRTRTYTLRKKNRLMYACRTGNVYWFRTLFRMTGLRDIVSVRTLQNESLYHIVCTLPVPTPKEGDNDNMDTNPLNKVEERIQILNTLFTTNIDMNVKTNTTKKQIAFDIVTDDSEALPNADQVQLIRWWLDHIDRLDVENRNRCLPWLAYDNRLEDVQRLCRIDSTDLNIETIYGDTALIMASIEGHTSIVDELLTYYPHRLTATHLNHQDKDGSTALFLACYNNDLAIVRSLCRIAAVDLNLPNQNGITALMIAAYQGHTSIVDELLTYYPHRLTAADLNHRNKNGDTALHLACARNHLAIVRSLCRIAAVDLNLPNEDGDTALIIATYQGYTSIVNELLTYYPHRLTATHLNHQDKKGDTALIIARRNGYTSIVDALRNHGVLD